MSKHNQEEDIFSEENEVKIPFAKWDVIGRAYKGVYVKKEIVPNGLRPGTNQALYTLADAFTKTSDSDWEPIEGTILRLSGRGNRNPAVMPALDICKFGQVVYLKFVEERKAKPGYNPAKVIRVFSKNEMKPEILDEFMGESEPVHDISDVQI